jgi:hypothetical protein
MSAYALSNFHEALRALIGDEGDVVAGYDYAASQLDGALRTVVRMGFLPCLALDPGDAESLAQAPANADTWAYLVAKAAHLLCGGQTPVSIRTRALSVMTDPAARRDSLAYIESMLSEIDARGNVCGAAGEITHKGLFGTVGDVVTWCKLGGCDLPL